MRFIIVLLSATFLAEATFATPSISPRACVLIIQEFSRYFNGLEPKPVQAVERAQEQNRIGTQDVEWTQSIIQDADQFITDYNAGLLDDISFVDLIFEFATDRQLAVLEAIPFIQFRLASRSDISPERKKSLEEGIDQLVHSPSTWRGNLRRTPNRPLWLTGNLERMRHERRRRWVEAHPRFLPDQPPPRADGLMPMAQFENYDPSGWPSYGLPMLGRNFNFFTAGQQSESYRLNGMKFYEHNYDGYGSWGMIVRQWEDRADPQD